MTPPDLSRPVLTSLDLSLLAQIEPTEIGNCMYTNIVFIKIEMLKLAIFAYYVISNFNLV